MSKQLAVLLMLCSTSAFCQTAKVIALDSADATKSQALHGALTEAQKAVDDFDASVRDKYTEQECTACIPILGKSPRVPMGGWSGGIVYSEDWKFIVPRPAVSSNVAFGAGCNSFGTGADSFSTTTLDSLVSPTAR